MRLRIIVLAAIVCAALLLGAAPAFAADLTQQDCVDCHSGVTPGVVTQFDQGAMSGVGVTCIDCHGADHLAIMQAQGKVPASTCADAILISTASSRTRTRPAPTPTSTRSAGPG